MKTSTMGIRSLSVSVILFLSSTSLAAIEETLKLPPKNRAQVLSQSGAATYADLKKMAFSSQHPMNLRWKALMGMAEAQKQKSVKDLLVAANHKEWFMRNGALMAMVHADSHEAVRLARQLLSDKALVVRSAAVEVLSEDLTSENRDILWEQLEKPINFKREQSLWIRPQIVRALADQPLSSEKIYFAQLLNEKEAEIQKEAIRGLEALTGKKLGQGRMARAEVVKLWRNELAR